MRYDPSEDKWRQLAPSPLTRRAGHSAVWTGEEMIVWGGVPAGEASDNQLVLSDGAAYDPEADSWRRIPNAPIRSREGGGAQAVWTGEEMIAWGGGGHRGRADGIAYDPASNGWRRIPEAPLTGRDRHTAVWTGSAMLVWGGCCDSDRYYADGALYSHARAE